MTCLILLVFQKSLSDSAKGLDFFVTLVYNSLFIIAYHAE